MDWSWYRARDVVSMIMMRVRKMEMWNGPDMFMRNSSLVSKFVSIAIELGPI